MISRVLLTGATGTIGSNLLSKLKQKKKIEIYVVLRKKNILFNSKQIKKIFYFDNEKSLKNISKINFNYVILASGKYENSSDFDTIESLIESNITISLKIIELIKFKKTKIIYLSTFSYLGSKGKYDPINLYSVTKKNFEDILYYYYKKNGLSICILYLYETYSDNDLRPKIFNILKKKILLNEEILLSKKNQSLNFTHIDDVCNAIINVLKNKHVKFERFSIKGEEVTLEKLVHRLKEISNIKLNYRFNSFKSNYRKKIFYFRRPYSWAPKIKLNNFLKNFFNF